MNIRAILLGTAACALLVSPAIAAKSNDYDQRLDQLQQMVQQQNAEIQELKAGEASEADDKEADAATAAQLDALQNQMYANTASEKSAWWQNTKVSGRMYFDVSDVEQKTNGVDVANMKGVGFDIKRFYIGVDHKFDDVFSANVTTDFLYDSTTKATQLYLKKAYLDAHISDALDLRLGSTDLPWIPFAEGVYGYRYVENTLIDRVKIGTSADWGVHASGKFMGGVLNYAISAINGAGYKAPPSPGNVQKFKSIDLEGRVSANFSNITLAVGGYSGKLGKDVQSGAVPPVGTTHHTATRFNALAAYTDDNIRVGVEYFMANNWNSVASPSTTTDKDSGYSAFASYKFDPQWGVFGRYDWVEEKNKSTAVTPPLVMKPNDNYYNVGITYSPAKIVDLSLVYKHDDVKHGAIATQNGSGSLGSNTGAKTGSYSEIGLFGQFQW